ncbi:MAG: tetratricopeptide repeat protein, partial [Streptosporangiaceae bacterium]|nr:tetratricopeptide repeat protein [Streptosporangiaceae bacterium]
MADRNGSPRFEVLGPLRAFRGETELVLGWPRQRAVLAALLLRAGQVVSRDELIDAVWGADPPPTAVNVVHAYIAGLRRALEPGQEPRARGRLLASVRPGYVLHIAESHLDLEVAERHLDTARRAKAAGDLRAAVAALGTAVAFWRGIPLGGVPGPLAQIERARLAELRLTVQEDRAETMLRLGAAADLAGELASLVAEHPFRERLASLLMRALYQSGRQAEALDVYRSTRRILAQELGIEPGLSLRRLHDDILRNRDITGSLNGAASQVTAAPVVPRQLPAAPRQFTGRRPELSMLAELAREAVTEGAVVIAAIGGTAGIGKSALAVQFAHMVADEFPDGQLYADLRGSGADPAPAQEVIRVFLDAFSVEPARIPADPRSQAALYRSVLAGKKVLLVLDDTGDEDQVRPLLPGGGCLVIVTSRRRLTGLAAAHGATLLTLDVLGKDEARDLLGRRIGTRRVSAEPAATEELAELCARLPLALSIAAARAAGRPQLSLARLAAGLRDEGARLDILDADESAGSVRSAFSWSYKALSAPAARMFRLLGIHPGPDVTIAAAASLAAVTAAQARGILAELDREHLITEHVPGRFAFHDLLRAYAAEQAQAQDGAAEREVAIHRILDHYLSTARAAAMWLHQGREPPFPADPWPGVVPEPLASDEEALAWFEAEYQVLLAAVTLAAGQGFDRHAWQLPWCLVTFLYRRGLWDQWAAAEHAALAAAGRLGDLAGQARAHLDLGYIGVVSGSHEGADAHLRRALALFGQLNDREGQARAHNAMAGLLEGQHRYLEAMRHAQLSLDLYLTMGNRAAHANALTEVGWLRALLGDHQGAISDATRALRLHRELGNRHGEAGAWHTLGYAHHGMGRHAMALSRYRKALAIRRELRDRQHEAEIFDRIGETQRALGHQGEAREAWQQALTILEDLRLSDADLIRA